MIFAANNSKNAIDRSISTVDKRIRKRIAGIDIDIDALTAELKIELEDLKKLSEQVAEERERIIEQRDEVKSDYDAVGIDRDDVFDEVDRLLTLSEEELNDAINDFDLTITCLEACQTCDTVQACNTTEETCGVNLYNTPASCSSCVTSQSCGTAYSLDPETCDRCFNTHYSTTCNTGCDSCQGSCYGSYTTTCDTCHGGTYSSTVCGEDQTVCVTCDGCDACQAGCYGEQSYTCSECYGVDYDDSYVDYECSNGESATCILFVTCDKYGMCGTNSYGDGCNGDYSTCGSTKYGDGYAQYSCDSGYVCEAFFNTSCGTKYSGCKGGGHDIVCESEYEVDKPSGCVSGYGTTVCSSKYTATDDGTTCSGRYELNEGETPIYCGTAYAMCENNQTSCWSNFTIGDISCPAGFSSGENGEPHCVSMFSIGGEVICESNHDTTGTTCLTCELCEATQTYEICTGCNVLQTVCDPNDAPIDVCAGTCDQDQGSMCYICIEAQSDLCFTVYDICGTDFTTDGQCNTLFGDESGCETHFTETGCWEGCQGTCDGFCNVGCETTCQSCNTGCDSCNSTCETSCQSCNASCQSASETCSGCYSSCYGCNSATYNWCGTNFSCDRCWDSTY